MGVKLQSSSGGSVEIAAPATASNYVLTAPAANGTILNDASSLAAANLAGNVDVARLVSAFSGSNVSLGTSGYQKLPSGLIIQWGRTAAGVSGVTVTLPISFSNAHLAAFAVTGAGTGGSTLYISTVGTLALSSLVVASGAAGNTVFWLAIGY